jgi:hypothetical protein
MSRVYANNAVSTFAAPITNVQTAITLTSGGGVKFPAISGGNTFQATFSDAATNTVLEIVTVTAVTGDTLTVIRAQEGTTGLSYLAGDTCSQRTTALELGDFLSKTYGGTISAPITATAVTATGLVQGNGGTGRGLGNVILQSGGSPSGGANGDVWLIY